MKKLILSMLVLSTACLSRAAVWKFDLSPPGTDRAVGLSSSNEVPAVTNSAGTGNEIGNGITFDTSTLTLSMSIGYGSALGFSNLTGPATMMHIHGPAPTNVAAGVLVDLLPLHTPATNPATGGSINGAVVYTADQVPFLLGGSNYINIHTATNPAGEIRGQLIATNNAPTVICQAPSTNECTGSGGRLVALTSTVADLDGDALTVVWTVDGAPVQTNSVPGAPTGGISADVSLAAFLTVGQHQVIVSASDGKAAPVTCSTTAAIVDTSPPTISSVSVSPKELWPPNHKMVPVTVSVVATDSCSTVTCKIKSITSDEGSASGDTSITGPLKASLRSERAGNGDGRTYTITVECSDSSGNSTTSTVTVTVPHDQSSHSKASKPAKPAKPAKGKKH